MTTHRAVLAAVLLCAGVAPEARAQVGASDAPPPGPSAPEPNPELDPYEGRPVHRILIEQLGETAPGQPKLTPQLEQLARNQLRVREGTPFSRQIVTEDVAKLTRLGQFRRVESRVQRLADGSVDIIYQVMPQRIVEDVQTVGNRLMSDEDLLRMSGVVVGAPMDPTALDRAARRIEGKYREKGYYSARVTVDQAELDKTGIVVFLVREGERTKVSEVRFSGNLSFTPEELKSQIKTAAAWLLSKGPLDDDLLADDVASLVQFYKDRGRLDVRADTTVTPSPNQKEAIVTFVIAEGPVYTLRSVKVKEDPGDEHVFSAEQLLGLMKVKPGDVYSDDKLRVSFDEVRNAYGRLGYIDAKVSRFELRDETRPVVDIELSVSSGRRFRTGQVIIRGNDITRDNVVRRRVTLRPDRPLDTTRSDETLRRLRDQRLFDPRPDATKVTIQPEDPDNPGYRDVLVEVKETNTGEVSFGAVVNADLGLSARVQLRQRNVDVTDVPDSWSDFFHGKGFRGGGQTLDLLFQPGVNYSNYAVTLGEPYLFESDYSGSASLYYRTRDWNAYTENRYGTEWRVGRRFGSRWSASVPLRIENVSLGNIAPDGPTDYFASEDAKTLTSVGLTLSRSTLDSLLSPSKGSIVSLNSEQFGSPGDYTFTKLEASYKRYFKLDEDFRGRRTTLLVNTSASYIPQDFDGVPFYERYYLGGRSMRGFAVRTIAPHGVRNDNGGVSDATVGGNFQFFAGLEVQRPFYEDILVGVLFLDTGTVNRDLSLGNYRAAVGFGFRIKVPQLSQVPMALDFGFPILMQEGDERRLFTFSLDIPFR